MTDRFHPLSMQQLTDWVFDELEQRDSIFGMPRELFFSPKPEDRFRLDLYGHGLDTPLGVAAGPHSQMAQNIIIAWLCGARFIELKTVQTLDELDVSKPCIDMQDEGYNVEWSQELKLHESMDEYVRAWVLIHALHRALGFPGDKPGVIFNASVGYNLEGIKNANVQEFLATMRDVSELRDRYVDVVAQRFPAVRDLEIGAEMCNSVTLSTMHGCPPEEIQSISEYLIREQGLHTSVKLNPTLLGPEALRGILNDSLGYKDVVVPDEAFGHDLKWDDALPMLHTLAAAAEEKGIQFGVKLTNTLEVENHRTEFTPDEKMMYMSGRALHAISTNVAAKLSEAFSGKLMMSFAGGADAFNWGDLLAAGMKTVTVCSDILKSGGYLRLVQYLDNARDALADARARDAEELSVRRALTMPAFVRDGATMLAEAGFEAGPALVEFMVGRPGPTSARQAIAAWAAANNHDADATWTALRAACARLVLAEYAALVRDARRYHKDELDLERTKTPRKLGLFDCIAAPCTDECPVDQKVPQYMNLVREGRFEEAVEIVRGDNPIPTILGRVCDHLCEKTCIRVHYDQPLAIREMKRFIMSREETPHHRPQVKEQRGRVAIIGAGPCGIAAAYYLAQEGFQATIFEAQPYAGGMVGGVIPTYRLPWVSIEQDLEMLRGLGVELKFGMAAGRDFDLAKLRGEGYEHVVIAVGAQRSKMLGVEGEDAAGVIDALSFLRDLREDKPVEVGRRVAVIGGGDVAMDCARTAWRLGDREVTVIYRRTIEQMPAEREEIRLLLEEGIEVRELLSPKSLVVEDGTLKALVCEKMELGDRDASGRRRPVQTGEEVEVPIDTLVLAISQSPVLDFFGDVEVETNRWGYIVTDPETMETSVAGVYSGGDVVGDGPSTIVKACGDAKTMARVITRRAVGTMAPKAQDAVDRIDLMRRRAIRAERVSVPHLALEERQSFEEVVLPLDEASARQEAARCLDCDQICSTCVSVCPNRAFLTYESDATEYKLPTLVREGDGFAQRVGATFVLEQQFQVAVQTDFCNECGNCATFCPTSGRPYQDKPRLYLDRPDFESQTANAFMLLNDGGNQRVDARYDGATHSLLLDGDLRYDGPLLTARLAADTLEVLEATPKDACAEGAEVSLQACAEMVTLLRGLAASAAHLPRYSA